MKVHFAWVNDPEYKLEITGDDGTVTLRDMPQIEAIIAALDDDERERINVVGDIVTDNIAVIKAYYQTERLCKCDLHPAGDPHTCPFSCEISDDCETECNCCDECTSQCADDI